MRYFLSLFCCLAFICGFCQEDKQEELILSTPDQLATLTSKPDQLIGNIVSPLSGHPVLSQTDLIVKGAQPIALTRTYIAPYMPCQFPQHKHYQAEYEKRDLYVHLLANYKGWQFLPHLQLQLYPSRVVRLSEPSGATLEYRIKDSQGVPIFQSYGISNAAGDEPNGKYDLRNTRVVCEEEGKKIVVYAADGSIRHYYRAFPTLQYWLLFLHKEILPNGKVLKYHYDSYRLIRVESMDPSERHVYASLAVSGSPSISSCHFVSSTGSTATYNYERRSAHVKIDKKVKRGHQKEEHNLIYPPLLTSVSSPFYRHETLSYCTRFLLGSHDGKENQFNALHACFGANPHLRVQKLLLRVGENDALEPVYEMHYQPPSPVKSPVKTSRVGLPKRSYSNAFL